MLLVPSGTTAAPAVHVTWPPSSILKFPPANHPSVLTPPVSDGTFARPFNINPDLYNNLLSVNYPITIALVYATSVVLLNRYNAQRDHKPWPFSKTSAFSAFVVLHNVFLAIYSAWTFAGMVNAIIHSWPSWHDDHGIAGVVDALCKINGPRGLGSAATYNSTTGSWGVTNELVKLANGQPDNTDVGRIWNEGLAYYGWLFYISKFYEVLDTMIILAKGKKSSLLQTYHHAGAMMCMWAGMRFMSPPIWMFVLVNSFIHALMVSSPLYTESGRELIYITVLLLHLCCIRHARSNCLQKGSHKPADRPIRGRSLICLRTSLHIVFGSSEHALSLYTQHLDRDRGYDIYHFFRYRLCHCFRRCW